MLRDDLIRIVKILQNDGIDEITNKKITNDQRSDCIKYFNDNVNHAAGTELIFNIERYGLPKNATPEQIVSFALKGRKNIFKEEYNKVKYKDNMLRDELIRIAKIFQNKGVDEITNKKVSSERWYDYLDFFDDNVNNEAGTELIFDPERYGLPKNATAEELVDYALNGKEITDIDKPKTEEQTNLMNGNRNNSIENIRNNNDSFTIEQKNRIRICMLKIGEVFIKCFANDDIVQEYENYMQTKQLNMPKIKKFLNEFEEEYFSYDLSYLAEELFKEMMVIYSLDGLDIIISDAECKCMNLNYNFLIEQSNLLEEKMYQCNHNSDSIFSGLQNYGCNEKIAEIIELAVKDENTDEKLQALYEELLQLNS